MAEMWFDALTDLNLTDARGHLQTVNRRRAYALWVAIQGVGTAQDSSCAEIRYIRCVQGRLRAVATKTETRTACVELLAKNIS